MVGINDGVWSIKLPLQRDADEIAHPAHRSAKDAKFNFLFVAHISIELLSSFKMIA